MIRRATTDDFPAIEQLLTGAHLPLDGARDAFACGVVAESGHHIVGAAALECYVDGALLRSVVVDASQRGQGLGRELTLAALDEARRRGIQAVYLLTTTAADFFPKLGFTTTTREAVPPAVRRSVEFQSACPASATVLVRSLHD